MVTKQKVRQRTQAKVDVATKTRSTTQTAQKITAQQSQALAQTFVHASFSAIAWMRDLVPSNCFVRKSDEDFAKLKDYTDFMETAQALASEGGENPKRGGYDTIVRGKDGMVDALLDQLQLGAFYALEQKILKAIILTVGLDKSHPERVLEAYTYTFAYRTTPQGTTVLDDIALNGTLGTFTFKETKHALTTLIRDVYMDCKHRPALPNEAYLTARLIFNEDYDRNVRIPGFRTDKGDHLRLGDADGWVRKNSDAALLDAGHVGMSLGISRLEPLPESGVLDHSDSALPASGDLVYEKFAMTAAMDARLDKRLEEQRQTRAKETHNPSASAGFKETVRATSKPKASTTAQNARILASQPYSQASTQTLEDIAAKKHLKGVINAPPVITNGGDTQLLGNSMPTITPENPPSRSTKIEFNPTRLTELEDSSNGSVPMNQSVRCECGIEARDDEMRTCCFCGTDQHIACYGYLGGDDNRLPDSHVCYRCLLSEEANLLEELKDLAIQRKVARVLINGACGTERQIADTTHSGLPTAKAIVEQLVRAGYIFRPKKRGQPGLAVVPDKRGSLMHALFEPASKITHHLKVPTVPELPSTGLTTQFTIRRPPSTMPSLGAQNTQKHTVKSNDHRERLTDTSSELNRQIDDLTDTLQLPRYQPSRPTSPQSPRAAKPALSAYPKTPVAVSRKRRASISMLTNETPFAKRTNVVIGVTLPLGRADRRSASPDTDEDL